MNEKHKIVRPASLGLALRRGFRAAYDNLGYVVFATFASFICTAAFMSLAAAIIRLPTGIPALASAGAVLLGVMTAYVCAVGVFYYAGKSVFNEHPTLADTWTGIKALFVPALGLFLVDLVITGVLAGDAAFFFGLMRARGSAAFAALGILCAYLALVWLMMMMYHLPLLAAQTRMESGPRVKVIMRKSYLLVADNPGFTVGLFLAIIAFAVLCALPALIGVAVLFLGVTAFLLTHALRELFVKYGVTEEEPEIVEEKPWRLPDSRLKREHTADKQ